MADHQKPGLLAKPQDDEAFFLLGVFRVVDHQGFFIVENRLRFFKGNLVLPYLYYNYKAVSCQEQKKKGSPCFQGSPCDDPLFFW